MKKNLLKKISTCLSRTTRLQVVAMLCFSATSLIAQTTFSYTGAVQTYTVPPGVTSIQIETWGAQGSGGNGGQGGYAKGDMTVTPGQVLNVYVGGQAGFNGGGLGHAITNRNGGGASDIRVSPYTLADRVIVAGGGGGGGQTDVGIRIGGGGGAGTAGPNYAGGGGGQGYGGNGGPGGASGGTGNTSCHAGGAGGGGLNSGGAASCNTCYGNTCGQAGSFGLGGNGDTWENGICFSSYGGTNGGGGGYYGGGGTSVGNCGGGAGGGGSSWTGTLTNITLTGGIRAGNGQVIITPLTQAGAALDFDGLNDVVTGTAPNMQNTDFSIEFWAKRRTSSTTQGLFLIGTDGVNNGAIFMYMFNNGGLAFGFWGNDLVVNQGSGLYQDLNWHHYALTYNTTTNQRIVYRDGVQIGSDIATADFTGNTNFMIGQFGGHSRTDGAIDEFRIWKRALCQAEIQANMSCEIPTTGTNLEANYHFNQGTAAASNAGVTTLTDVSGFNRNCTLTDFALTGATSNWITPGGVVSGVSCTVFNNAVAGTLSAQTNVSCNGGNDGSATVTATGLGAYIYSWAPSGGTAATATGLTAGTYTCTISNACGGSNTVTVTITEPPVLAVSVSSTNATCFVGGDGTATATPSGGTAPYSYQWSNGGTTQTITLLSQGAYTCTVTCTNGCSATQTVAITHPNAITATSTQTDITCFGGSNGATTLVASGGTPGYSYLWSPSGGTAATASGLTAGTYNCAITDTNGCNSTLTVTITEPPALASSSSVTAPLCNGDSATIIITASGGTAPYFGTGTFMEIAGTYTFTVTDGNGCTTPTIITVTEPAALAATTTFTNPSLCNGIDGAINLSVSGGTPGYTYLWSNTAITQDISFLAAGVYSCTISDANGCISSVSVTLTGPNPPTVTLAITADTVCGLDGVFILMGGSPAGGSYSGPGVSGGSFNPATANAGINTITYTYTDNQTGCTASNTDIIYVDPCVGVNENTVANEFVISPNPNNGTFIVQLNTNQQADILIYDAVGKLVSAEKVQPNTQQQISIESAGVYLITVVTADGQRSSQRVVVSK